MTLDNTDRIKSSDLTVEQTVGLESWTQLFKQTLSIYK
jgi:hypothetical protein